MKKTEKKREVCKNCKHCFIKAKSNKLFNLKISKEEREAQYIYCHLKGIFLCTGKSKKDQKTFNLIESGNSLPMECFNRRI